VFAIIGSSLSAHIRATFPDEATKRRLMRGECGSELRAIIRTELVEPLHFGDPRQPFEVTSDAGERTNQRIAIGMRARFRNCTECCLTDVSS